MKNKKQPTTTYTPLYYLSSLGAGGIATAFWKLGDVTSQSPLMIGGEMFFWLLAVVLFLVNFVPWTRALAATDKFFGLEIPPDRAAWEKMLKRAEQENPAVSTGWMAMPAAFVMLLNSGFAVLPVVFPISMKAAAPYGFAIWLISFTIAGVLAGQILLNTFAATAERKDFHFGLFLQPLVFGLHAIPAVTMSGLLPQPWGDMALLLGLTAFSIGGILGAMALIFVFDRFMEYGLPEPKLAPTTLLIMPSITVYTIFVLKTFHLIAHHYELPIPHVWVKLVALTGIGLMGATTTLGLIVLAAYFRKHVPFSPSWWSFVCPFVALSVLSSITYQMAGEHLIFLISAILALVVVVTIYIYVASKTLTQLRQKPMTQQ